MGKKSWGGGKSQRLSRVSAGEWMMGAVYNVQKEHFLKMYINFSSKTGTQIIFLNLYLRNSLIILIV